MKKKKKPITVKEVQKIQDNQIKNDQIKKNRDEAIQENKLKRKNLLKLKKDKLINNINSFSDKLWFPNLNTKTNIVHNNNSWFFTNESNPIKDTNSFKYEVDDLPIVKKKCKRIELFLTLKQKSIINNWLIIYLEMYNYTIKFLKNNINIHIANPFDHLQNKFIYYSKKENRFVVDWETIRAELFDVKHNLILQYSKNIIVKEKIISKKKKFEAKYKTKKINANIKVHDLDLAIRLACTMYSNAYTMYKFRKISSFRLRYWKYDKPNKIMSLEKDDFKLDGIRSNILGKMKGYYNDIEIDFSKIDCECMLQKRNEKYYLFIPENIKLEKIKERENMISLDPGVRTFLTGYTENKVVILADRTEDIKKYIKRRERINKNINISQEIKKKNERLCNRKIGYMVDDMHWQIINYLTSKYETILIGNMSTKSIVDNKRSKLSKITKQVAYALKLYEFKSRLKYKCYVRGNKYKEVDEYCTSKLCSNCGNEKEDLGGQKEYKCENCKNEIGRDINGARNIAIRSII